MQIFLSALSSDVPRHLLFWDPPSAAAPSLYFEIVADLVFNFSRLIIISALRTVSRLIRFHYENLLVVEQIGRSLFQF